MASNRSGSVQGWLLTDLKGEIANRFRSTFSQSVRSSARFLEHSDQPSLENPERLQDNHQENPFSADATESRQGPKFCFDPSIGMRWDTS
jgi:hypothetical protein